MRLKGRYIPDKVVETMEELHEEKVVNLQAITGNMPPRKRKPRRRIESLSVANMVYLSIAICLPLMLLTVAAIAYGSWYAVLTVIAILVDTALVYENLWRRR